MGKTILVMLLVLVALGLTVGIQVGLFALGMLLTSNPYVATGLVATVQFAIATIWRLAAGQAEKR